MIKCYIDDLAHLTDNEKIALKDIHNFVFSRTSGVREFLVGSKSRGDYKDTSDVDIIALYEDDNMDDELGFEVVDFVNSTNSTYGVTISYMLFPEEVEYYSEDEAKQELNAYSWIPKALLEDGIKIKFRKR